MLDSPATTAPGESFSSSPGDAPPESSPALESASAPDPAAAPDSPEAAVAIPGRGAHSGPLLDTRQLIAFASLAETGSFTQTARDLNVSQSAVSHTIGDLERRVGCRLFERNSRRVLLTLAGEQLLHHVRRIRSEMEAARDSLHSLKSWGQIQLRLSAPAAICDGLLPFCLHQISRDYPKARVSVTVADRREALQELAAGRIDLAVCPGFEPDERFDRRALFEDELVFVVNPSHPWANSPPPRLSDIGAQPLLTYRRQSYTWNLLMDHLHAAGIHPTIAFDGDSVAAIREMARLGMGVAVLARWYVAADVAAGRLACLPIPPRPLLRPWAAFYMGTRRLSRPQSLLIEHLGKAANACLAYSPPKPAST